jgi:Xaa-Pro dipeptidase
MAMKSGVIARDVDAIMRRGALDTGLRPTYENVTAYTLGLYTRTPRTSDFSRVLLPTSDWALEEGMVFHLYATAQGLGFSEMVVVDIMFTAVYSRLSKRREVLVSWYAT